MSTTALMNPLLGAVDGLPVGVLVCDGQGSVHAVTADTHRLLGGDLTRVSLTDDHGVALPPLDVLALQVARTDTAATLAVIVNRRRHWLELYPMGLQVLAVLRPVHTDVMRDKGLLDPVTGLPNRVLLFDRLGQALRRADVRGTRMTLVLAELDRPDERALRETGACLAKGLCGDHTVARYAAGTFAVVVEHVAGSGVPIARRVVSLVPHPVRTVWVTSDGTHSVHDVVAKVEEKLLA